MVRDGARPASRAGAAAAAARARHGRRAAAHARPRRQRGRALRSAGDGARCWRRRRRASRSGRVGPALPHEHAAALPRRSRRRQGRGAVARSTRSCSRGWACSRSRRARPTRRPSCSGPTSAAPCPTRRARSSRERIGRAPTLVVIYGDGLSAAAMNQHLAEFHRALERALAARGIGHAPPFFVRHSRVKIMDEIARLVERAGGAVRLRRAPRPRLRRLACRPTTSTNPPPARPTPTAR